MMKSLRPGGDHTIVGGEFCSTYQGCTKVELLVTNVNVCNEAARQRSKKLQINKTKPEIENATFMLDCSIITCTERIQTASQVFVCCTSVSALGLLVQGYLARLRFPAYVPVSPFAILTC